MNDEMIFRMKILANPRIYREFLPEIEIFTLKFSFKKQKYAIHLTLEGVKRITELEKNS